VHRSDCIEYKRRVATFLADAGHLPRGVPLLKRVRAVSDQTVCRIGYKIAIDGVEVGQALERDYRGRLLPDWQGCRPLADSDVFLMNSHPGSLDGRYFGVLSLSSITGRASAALDSNGWWAGKLSMKNVPASDRD
jgi:type IV secretory pathway protease TraF